MGVQGIARDITGRDAAELELRHAQKLESVGRLASGIAHEINTPIQFVGDNTRFLQDSFGGLANLLTKYQELRDAAASGAGRARNCWRRCATSRRQSDCAYLLEEIPKALAQTLEGVTRVATIVRAMKEFAHPESKEMAAADLNRALQSTLTVARNELKYVADVETEFGDLPLVVCNVGDLNQVFLNLLVNAAHAIGEIVNRHREKGQDSGSHDAGRRAPFWSPSPTPAAAFRRPTAAGFSIPSSPPRKWDAERGRAWRLPGRWWSTGTRGALTFESEVGKGTTFYVRLPVDPGECSKETKDAMRRVLFVDDEPRILEGLRRMLRPQRHEWEMAFAPGGEAALAMMEASPFDVIVSDMRMPGIDGAALLCAVREHVSPGGAHRAFGPHGTVDGVAGGSRRASVPGQALRCAKCCASPSSAPAI